MNQNEEYLELEKQLREYCLKANKAADEWCQSEEVFEALKDFKDVFFAERVDWASGETNAAKERNALMSFEWKEWLGGYQAARSKAREARIKRDNWQRMWDTTRSLLSTMNASRRTNT